MTAAALNRRDGDRGRLRQLLAFADLDADGGDGLPRRRTSHDWLVDLLLFAVSVAGGFLIWGLEAEAAEHRGGLTPREGLVVLVDAGVGLLLCLAVWWRRRWPVALAAAACAAATFAAASAVAGMVLLWTAIAHRRLATTLALSGAITVAAAVYPLVHPDPDLPYVGEVLLGVVINAVVVFSALYVRARRQVAAMAAERGRRAAADRERELARARQHERARIAREMHDVLGHRLSLVSMHAGALEYRPDASPDEIAAAAGVVRRSAHQALQDLREVIAVLREEPDAEGSRPQPTLADLPALVEESCSAGIRVRADWGGLDLAAVPDATGRAAYRIVQEALTNVRTHAPGVVASLRVGGAPGHGVRVEVSNPLPLGGVRPRASGGTGLIGLAERAELAGGRLEHGPTPDKTFRVAATLPWPSDVPA